MLGSSNRSRQKSMPAASIHIMSDNLSPIINAGCKRLSDIPSRKIDGSILALAEEEPMGPRLFRKGGRRVIVGADDLTEIIDGARNGVLRSREMKYFALPIGEDVIRADDLTPIVNPDSPQSRVEVPFG